MTHNDPFAGEFSQERARDEAASLAPLQWLGGRLTENNAWFIEDKFVEMLGLDPTAPPPPFQRVAEYLGSGRVSGWAAGGLELSFLLTEFHWEDRETGRLRFPADEYERRKRSAPGTERELRGRTEALVVVRELLEAGCREPVKATARGTFSAALNRIIGKAGKMATEATRLRRAAGLSGSVPREAFWVPVYGDEPREVGERGSSSTVVAPTTDIPETLDRDFLIGQLVAEEHRRPGGTFDVIAEQYREAWEARGTGGEVETEEDAGAQATGVSQDEYADALYRAQNLVRSYVGQFAKKVGARSLAGPQAKQGLVKILALPPYNFPIDTAATGVAVYLLETLCETGDAKQATQSEVLGLSEFLGHDSARALVETLVAWMPGAA